MSQEEAVGTGGSWPPHDPTWAPPPPPPPDQPAQWAPPLAPPPPPPPAPVAEPPRWRSLSGLASALTILFTLDAIAGVFGLIAIGNRIKVIDDFQSGNFAGDIIKRARDADDLATAAAVMYLLLALATAVVFIVWMWRAAKNNEALGRFYPRLKPGWAIAGWLIPLANLVIPVLILQDLWRGSEPSTPRGDPGWRSNRGSSLIGWYWAAFILSSARFGLGRSEAHFGVTKELRDLRTHDSIAIFGLVMSIVAAILLIQVVRRIAARQEETLRTQQTAWNARA